MLFNSNIDAFNLNKTFENSNSFSNNESIINYLNELKNIHITKIEFKHLYNDVYLVTGYIKDMKNIICFGLAKYLNQ